jgi:hypothetical protein
MLIVFGVAVALIVVRFVLPVGTPRIHLRGEGFVQQDDGRESLTYC